MKICFLKYTKKYIMYLREQVQSFESKPSRSRHSTEGSKSLISAAFKFDLNKESESFEKVPGNRKAFNHFTI